MFLSKIIQNLDVNEELAMNKIIALLKEIGASDQLASAVSEELVKYDKEIHDKYQTAYNIKLQKAKQICIEEVENYKVDLANKVSVFLESKAAQIEKRIEKQRAVEESSAMGKLQSIRNITEGIEVASDAEIKALRERIEQLSNKVKTLTEEKKRAEIAANRANEMALSIIRESRAKAMKPVIEEDAKKKDDNKQTKEKKSETVKGRRVVSGLPKTSNPRLVELQVPTKSFSEQKGVDVVDDKIVQIANQI